MEADKGEKAYDINTSDIAFRIGRGGFGDVFLVTHKNTGKKYAMKLFHIPASDLEGKERVSFERNH